MALNNFIFPKRYAYYDSERRERKGAVSVYGNYDGENRNGIDFTDAYVQTFTINTEDTTSEINIGSYANGVNEYIRVKAVESETNTTYVLNIEHYLKDKNGNFIPNVSDPFIQLRYYNDRVTISKTANPDKTALKMFISRGELSYSADYVSDPLFGVKSSGLTALSKIYVLKYTEGGLYPQLNQYYSNNMFSQYYTGYSYSKITTDEGYNKYMKALVDGGDGTIITPILPSDDTSGTGGGDVNDPDYNPFSDNVDFPDLPTYGAINTGLITAYHPSIVQLRLLANKLWSDNFFQEIKKINNDPMEAVISLHLLPFNVPVAGSANCKIGNYDSEISMGVIETQFLNISGGSFKVNERFASALDYSPYTSVHIHIPFVGIVPLDIDYVMKKQLILNYQVDVLTGSAVAMLKCDGAILYTFPCNMAMTTPLTSSNHQALYREIIQTSASVGHTIVAGATGGRADGGGLTQGAKASVGHGMVSSLESALNTVASKHSEVQKSGSLTGVQGILDSYETYLIFHRPIQSLAQNFSHFKGFPCNITYNLSALSGYTEVEYAHLEGVTATDEEKNEIQMLLQTGVIL